MTDPLLLPKPFTTPAASRQYRSSSGGSPTRPRHTDDLLANLTPATAPHVFRNPSGPLKLCLDAATASEQSFAMRAGIASKHVQEWLTELSSWPWPADGGSAGFELPTAKRRKLFVSEDNHHSSQSGGYHDEHAGWIGSLPAADVAAYDKRISAIQQEMAELDIEEIKRHVLHNHILPLSRPGTPLESTRPATPSLFSFNKMGDLTAILTTVVLQMLPNLSKLIRLMNTWSVRLLVLKRVPPLLTALADTEVAIQSGWNAIQVAANGIASSSPEVDVAEKGNTTLTRRDFEVMKGVLEMKVSKAGRLIDYMLDSLDGREDTIPEDWIDRMDKAERDYSGWVATCERKIRTAEWKKIVNDRPVLTPPVLTPQVLSRPTSPTSRQRSPERGRETRRHEHLEPPGISINVHAAPEDKLRHVADRGTPTNEDLVRDSDDPEHVEPRTAGFDGPEDRALANGDNVDSESGIVTDVSDLVACPLHTPMDGDDSHWVAQNLEAFQANANDELQDELEPRQSLSSKSSAQSLGSESSLPQLNQVRPGSHVSAVSTIVNGTASGLDLSSDLPDVANSPQLPRLLEREPAQKDGASPPSSPPDFRASVRSTVTFNDIPTVAEIPHDETPPKTPLDSPFLDDSELPREVTSPSRMSVASEDEHLQQQISDILESIPAKIKLSSQPTVNHLNPPDLQLPRAKPKPVDPNRSQSAMSSRAGTPSFLLAPAYAKHGRPRHQRGNQEIKLYHLSRSTGEAPIKLFIRLVGENGERVMVRVGGGWADLGEYLKEYASHHGRRSKTGEASKIEVRDLPPVFNGKASTGQGSSPPSRPASALDSPMTPLTVRKTRRSIGEDSGAAAKGVVGARNPRTPLANLAGGGMNNDTPSSEASTRSRSSSRLSWTEEDSSLGMSGPRTKKVEMSQESRAWVESVKEKVRAASGSERRVSGNVGGGGVDAANSLVETGRFGEMEKVGGTKRLFRKK